MKPTAMRSVSRFLGLPSQEDRNTVNKDRNAVNKASVAARQHRGVRSSRRLSLHHEAAVQRL